MHKAVKEKVAQRANFRCEYCFTPVDFSPDPFSIDHIMPKSVILDDDLENLAFCCLGYNNYKHKAQEVVDPLSGAITDIYNPRKDNWADHFQWESSMLKIEGITPLGRATVNRLQLNRPGLVNLRRLLHQFGYSAT